MIIVNLIVFYDGENIRKIVGKFQADFNAQVYRIETLEPVGFFSKLKNEKVAIKRCNLNLLGYDNVIIISPLWYNKVPGPVLRFLEQATGRVKNVSYVLYNNNKKDCPNEFDKMDRILNMRRGKSSFVTLDQKEIHVRVY